MSPRHPTQWLFSDPRLGDLEEVARRLPPGTGVIVRHHHLPAGERRRLLRRMRRLAGKRGLVLIDEAGGRTARVHDAKELRQARLRSAEFIFLSSLFATRSHPERRPLLRMRAAALARLGERRLLALGGMDAGRFARLRQLGFVGWGGIDHWVGPRNRQPGRDGSPRRPTRGLTAQVRT